MLKVRTYPDPVLTTQCLDVTDFDDALKRLAVDMATTMYASNGVGLAAPQVGVTKKIIVIDPSAGDLGDELVTLVNPDITWRSVEVEAKGEGCLSLPGVTLTVPRHLAITVEYNGVDGQRKKLHCSGWKARIIQHETDHLLGITALERVGRVARRLALKNLGKS